MEEKSNVSRVKQVKGSYSFRIEGYSGLAGAVSDSVESPEFVLCDYTWQLRIFPGGSLDAHRGYLSFYLASKSATDACVSYKLSVVNHILGLENESFSSPSVRTFAAIGSKVDGWGRDKFMSVPELLDPDNGFYIDDCVVFRVDMTVYGELELVANESTSRSITLSQCFHNLLANPVVTDVTLYVDDDPPHTILVNKCVLMARSPVFYAMFSHGMKENECGEVYMSDFEAGVVRELVHFMYTDTLSPTATEVSHYDLLRISCKYQVPGLMDLCEQYFTANVTADTVVPILQMAQDHRALHLKVACLQFIARTPSDFTKHASFLELDAELVREVLALIEAFQKGRKGSSRSAVSSSSLDDSKGRNNSTCIIM